MTQTNTIIQTHKRKPCASFFFCFPQALRVLLNLSVSISSYRLFFHPNIFPCFCFFPLFFLIYALMMSSSPFLLILLLFSPSAYDNFLSLHFFIWRSPLFYPILKIITTVLINHAVKQLVAKVCCTEILLSFIMNRAGQS